MDNNKIFATKEYNIWFDELKNTIKTLQIQAAFKVNETLLQLYWNIGKSISDKQISLGWGAKVIDKLSKDLRIEFPESKGFSARNLKYMKLFAETYPDFPIVQVPLALPKKSKFVQVPLAQITWYHHITLISLVKDMNERVFYMLKTNENGWSRDIMIMQIESGLYKRKGKAITNFKSTLPASQSALAKDIFKDPYNLDFLTIKGKADERNIETQLTKQITDFLIELGKGFAFVGRQYYLEVGNKDYYIDLLFYHLKLRCYIIVELKAVDFEPEFVGKLNFYLSAADDKLRTENDNPSIGLLLCRSKNHIKAEYALRGYTQPMGIAEYNFSKAVPENIKSELPSIEEIEKEFDNK